MTGLKPSYPRRSMIERTIAAARASGMKVGGFEIDPDGTIRILAEQPAPNTTDGAYERWQAKRSKAA